MHVGLPRVPKGACHQGAEEGAVCCDACAGLEADIVLLIFTLAALDPQGQAVMLQNAYKVRCGLFQFALHIR